jgi:hypothetical protein
MERLLSRDDQGFLFNCRSEEVCERTMRFHKQAVLVRVKEPAGQYRPAPARLPGAVS